jgi:hypothetical protein
MRLVAIGGIAGLGLVMAGIIVSELLFGRFRELATRVMAATVVVAVLAGAYLVLINLRLGDPVSCPDRGMPVEEVRAVWYGQSPRCDYADGRSLQPLD